MEWARHRFAPTGLQLLQTTCKPVCKSCKPVCKSCKPVCKSCKPVCNSPKVSPAKNSTHPVSSWRLVKEEYIPRYTTYIPAYVYL